MSERGADFRKGRQHGIASIQVTFATFLPSNDNAIGWNPGDLPKLQASNNPYRPYKVNRFRGRRIRGTSRSIWSSLYDSARVIGSSRRPGGPYTRPPYQTSVLSTGINALKPYKMMGLTSMEADRDINSRSLTEECRLGSPTDATNRCPEQTVRCDYNSEPTRLPTSSHSSPTKAHNLVGNPIVILNPKEPREIFIGGIHTVPLPLWAYKKCLTMVRGEPHELGPRLCLRLLQSLFSLHYLVTHNYNGSGGKAPIDPTVMGAVLRQAQIQFGSGYFFTEPMALGKLRDYLNNAFRVMAFRQRKGERVRSPFWNEQGEPVHGLEAPLEFAETSDVIVLTPTGDLFQELSTVDERIKPSRDKVKLNSGNPVEWDKSDSS
ncbi:hypothetical protein P879_02163 [Paragonimus westermani]|uniref:DUF5725 domain-containing protein n=1 Tax=Paragonimus westermani TaxID=34504 RepID=A0A8T0DRB9_9TREM|nr:hypothetical protein P879_02163 [Paragonimus westermani]